MNKQKIIRVVQWLLLVLCVIGFLGSCGNAEPSSVAAEIIESVATESETTESETTESETTESETTESETTVSQESLSAYDMTVHFLDVGQGLAIFAQSGGETLIYDGGGSEASGFVVAYLRGLGVTTVDYLISSHYDEDHISGLIGCLNAFTVEHVIGSDYVHDSKTYQSFMNAVHNENLSVQSPEVGEEFSFGTGKFVILAPETIDESDSNENSVAIKLLNGDNSFVFTGDAGSGSEHAMCQSGIDLDCDVLVPGHHGSATATSWELLEKTVPEYAVISCGAGNSYGHPHKDTMDKLESMDISVYRTDIQGTIVVKSDGSKLEWEQEPCNDYTPGDAGDAGTEPQTVDDDLNTATTPEPMETSNPTENVQEQGEMVWLSQTGSKYHNKPDCGRMNPDKAWQVSRSQAESMGYDACKNCYK